MTLDGFLHWDFDAKQHFPDYYLLLGCDGHEDDPLALQAAVDAVLSDLRKRAHTLRQQDQQAYERITRNVLYAQKVLTNPGLKLQYDARLLKQQRSQGGSVVHADGEPITGSVEAQPPAEAPLDFFLQIEQDACSSAPVQRRSHRKSQKRSRVATLVWALAGVLVVGVGAGIAWTLAFSDREDRDVSRAKPQRLDSSPARAETADATAERNRGPVSGAAAPATAVGSSPEDHREARLTDPAAADLATTQPNRGSVPPMEPREDDDSLPQGGLGPEAGSAQPQLPTREQIAEQLAKLREQFPDYEAVERLAAGDARNRRTRQQELATALLRFSRAADVRTNPALWLASLQDAYRLAREARGYVTAAEVLAEMAAHRFLSAAEVQASSATLLTDAIAAENLDQAQEAYDALVEKGLALPASSATTIRDAVVSRVEEKPAHWQAALELVSRLPMNAQDALKTKAKILLSAAADPAHRRSFETYEPIAGQMLDLVPDSLRAGNLAGARLLVDKAKECPSRTSANDSLERKRQNEARKALVARRQQVEKLCDALTRIATPSSATDREDREMAIKYFLEQGKFDLALPHLEATGNPLFPLLKPDPQATASDLVKRAQELEKAANQHEDSVGRSLLRYALGLLSRAQGHNEDPLLRCQIDAALLRLDETAGADPTDFPLPEQTGHAQGVRSVNPLIWARIRSAIGRNQMAYSPWGYPNKQEPKEFRFVPESGGVLVGVNFHQNLNWHAITAMQFVFLGPGGKEAVSPMYGEAQPGDVIKVRAPEGLAVNQLLLHQGDSEGSNEIRAFRVGFGPIRVPGVAVRSAAAQQGELQGPGGPGKPVLLHLPGDYSIIGVEGKYATVIGRMRVLGVGTERSAAAGTAPAAPTQSGAGAPLVTFRVNPLVWARIRQAVQDGKALRTQPAICTKTAPSKDVLPEKGAILTGVTVYRQNKYDRVFLDGIQFHFETETGPWSAEVFGEGEGQQLAVGLHRTISRHPVPVDGWRPRL